MQTTIPLYGFGGGSGGTGASLTVNAPAGCTVTVSKDGKAKTKVAGTDGVTVFKGLATGAWTVSISDGEQTAQKSVAITADYSTAITFFAATIHITYPAGSTCKATNGATTLTAPGTSGTWDCVVPNAGTWIIEVVGKPYTDSVEIIENGQTEYADVTGLWLVHDGEVGQYGFSAQLRTECKYPVTQQDGFVNIKGYRDYTSGVLTNQKVDVTGYSTIEMRVNIGKQGLVSQTHPVFVGVSLVLSNAVGCTSYEIAASAIKAHRNTKETGEQTLMLSVDGMSGEYYIGITLGAASASGSTTVASANVYSIRLM